MDGSLNLYRGDVSGTKPKLKRTASSLQDCCRIQNANPLDALLESVLDFYDSSAIAFGLSFERIIESRICDSDKDGIIERTIRLGSTLTEVAERSARRRASMHNAIVWALPDDLTIKVFSMLDTQSLCHAAAACCFFQKCAADPLCYSNIDLTTDGPKANNLIVSTMIERAGKALRSIKLGVNYYSPIQVTSSPWIDKKYVLSTLLSRSCLNPLIGIDGCSPGALLKRLHLYNIERIDNISLDAALSACPALLDLEIIGLFVDLSHTLRSVSAYCHLIERLCFVSSKTGRDDSFKLPLCAELVKNCPNMSSLALKGFKLQDCKARALVKGFRRLKYIDLSTSYSFTGEFLMNLGSSASGTLLEVIILRDCLHLREAEVSRLLASIHAGRFKHLRLLDISNRDGLGTSSDWYCRSCTPRFDALAEVLELRPSLRVVADFPTEERTAGFAGVPPDTSTSDVNSETSWTSSSPYSSYASDRSSIADEDLPNNEIDVDSSDDLDSYM